MIKIQDFAFSEGNQQTILSREEHHVLDAPGEASPQREAGNLLAIGVRQQKRIPAPHHKSSRRQGKNPGGLATGVKIVDPAMLEIFRIQVGHLLASCEREPQIPLGIGGNQRKNIAHRGPSIRTVGVRVQMVEDVNGPGGQVQLSIGIPDNLSGIEPHGEGKRRSRGNRENPETPAGIKGDQDALPPRSHVEILGMGNAGKAENPLARFRINLNEGTGSF